MENTAKKRKLNENVETEVEFWKDMDITEEEFDFVLSQVPPSIVKEENKNDFSTKNDENEFAKIGEIQILRKNVESLTLKLDKEKLERDTHIESKLSESRLKIVDLERKIKKLETEVKFKNQDLTNVHNKLQNFEHQFKAVKITSGSAESRKLMTNKLICKKSGFENNPIRISAETQTDNEPGKMTRNFQLKYSHLNYSLFENEETISNPVVFTRSALTTLKNDPIQINRLLSPPGNSELNIKKLRCCKKAEEEKEAGFEKPEKEYLFKLASELWKYYEILNQNFELETQNSQYNLYNSDAEGSVGNSPEKIETKSAFFKTQFSNEISNWNKLKNEILRNLQKFRIFLTSSSSYVFFQNLHTDLFFKKMKSVVVPSDSGSSSSSSDSAETKSRRTLASLFLFVLTPIFFEGHVINVDIINWCLIVLNVSVSDGCCQCCRKAIQPVLKRLCFSTFFDGSCEMTTPFLTLKLILNCDEETINHLFSKHANLCLLKNVLKSFKHLNAINFNRQSEYVTLQINLLNRLLINTKRINCECFLICTDYYLKWLTRAVRDKLISDPLLEKSLKLILAILNDRKETAAAYLLNGKYILLINFLSETVCVQFPNSKITNLVRKISEYDFKDKCEMMDVL